MYEEYVDDVYRVHCALEYMLLASICCARYIVLDMLCSIYCARYVVLDILCSICCARYIVLDMLCSIYVVLTALFLVHISQYGSMAVWQYDSMVVW
jgi:hypothetical protein